MFLADDYNDAQNRIIENPLISFSKVWALSNKVRPVGQGIVLNYLFAVGDFCTSGQRIQLPALGNNPLASREQYSGS